MADTVPMIAISAEADDENFSLSDSEEANKAKSLIASRMRRRHKRKRDETKPSAALIVDDGDESGLTDVETVECEGDGANTDTSSISNAADELAPVFEIRPHIVHIVEEEDGKTRVNTIVQGVIAKEDSDDSDADENQRGASCFVDVATDIENFEDSSSDEESSVSESSDMRNAIGSIELGGNVESHTKQEEGKAIPCSGSSLQLPTAGRKKTRKHRSKKKAAATATVGGLLAVGGRDDDQLTDVESISGVEELEADDQASPAKVKSAALLTVTPAPDEGVTDIESLSGMDDDSTSISIHLAPGILVTGDDDVSTASGRSSRLGLTDVEDLPGDESPSPLLGLPQASADPLTDVEDIDDVEDDEPRTIPPNGPAGRSGQSHVVDITEDENGRITSRKMARSPALLGAGLGCQDEGGVTETESFGVSGDEGDDISAEHPAPEIHLESTTVDHKSDPTELEDPEAAGTVTSASGYSLLPPVSTAEILTDTEEMEMSDNEGPVCTEAEDQAASAAYQQYDPTCSAISESEPSLPSQPDWSDSAQGGN